MKKFFTLDRHHDGGFTLVELIVVIAILAILAGVAVPAYSGYIKEANKTADQNLVSEVAKALTMHYYNSAVSGTDMKAGYVVLKHNGNAESDGEVGSAAMEAAFGANWAEATALKYGEWGVDSDLMEILLPDHFYS